MSELRDVPGRERDLEQLVGVCRILAEQGGSGRVVFVAGGPSSGRGALLRALAEQLAATRGGPAVLAGHFVEGRYVPSGEDPAASTRVLGILKRLGEAGEWIAGTLGDVGVPYAGLVGQLLAHSGRPLELLAGLAARPATPELAPRLLSRLCRQGPVVWLVDDADLAHGGGLWADLILGLADRITRDLPLVLILGLDGPRQLGGHEKDESDSLYVARQLTGNGRALWHPLVPVGREELRRFTGPASRDVLGSLLTITGGEPVWAGALWREWQRDGTVQDAPETGWGFAAGGRDAVLDEVDALLGERLKRLIGEHLNRLERARRVLACAALEGERFTAAAIADALELDRDRLIDFLDDTLTAAGQHPDGLLVEDGWVHLGDESGSRSLAMYRFARAVDWLTLFHHGLTVNQQRFLARRLADALARHYGGQAHRIAHTLIRLYTLATVPDRASYYRRMADNGTARQVILWRARNVLNGDEPTDGSERRRASQTLIAAANELFHTGPFSDGLAFAQAAHRLAPLKGDRAHALYLCATHRADLGDYERARSEHLAALELWRELDDRDGEAQTRHGLATIDFEQGDYERARSEHLAVLKLWRELGDRDGEAQTRHGLATIDSRQGDYERARSEHLAVLELWRDLGDRDGEAQTRHALAGIDFEQGDYERARSEYLAVLELWRELRDRRGEAMTLHALAGIDSRQGDYERARSEYLAVLELWRELGDRRGEADALNTLARIEAESAEPPRA